MSSNQGEAGDVGRDSVDAFQVCVECRPQYAEAYLRLARVYARLGRASEARARLDSARRLAPFDAATTNQLEEVERELAGYRGE